MKNKSLIIINIIILSCIVIGLIAFMIVGNWNFTFENKTEVLLDHKLDEKVLNIDVRDYDIAIKENDEDNIHVVVESSSKNSDEIKINEISDKITIAQKKSHACFGICYFSNRITIYIGKNYDKPLNLVSTSGDIKVLKKLNGENHVIKTTSGDIEITGIKNSDIKSTSGNILIYEGESISSKTTSGDIELISLKNKAELKSTSGEIEVKNMSGSIDVEATSGDIEIKSFNITGDSKISTKSGEIDIYLNNDAIISAVTTSGDKEIKNSMGEYSLYLRTTSGDITVK